MSKKEDKELKKIKDKVGSRVVFPQKLEDWIKSQGNTLNAIDDGHVAFIRFKFNKTIVKSISVDQKKVEEAITNAREGTEIVNIDSKTDIIEGVEPPVQEIIMPIRPVTDTLGGNWQGVEGLGLLQKGFGKYLSWKILKSIGGMAGSVIPNEIMIAFKKGVLGSSGLDNPHEQLLYAGHNRRTLDITFNFLKPESLEDEKRLNAILDVFRICSVGVYGDLAIYGPPTVDIEFVSLPGYNNFLRYKNCGIQSCSVTYGGDGDQFKAMTSGMPFVSLSLSFGELDYVLRDQLTMSENSKIRMK